MLPDNSSLFPFHAWGAAGGWGGRKRVSLVLFLFLLSEFWWCSLAGKHGASFTLVSSLLFLKTAQKPGNCFSYCSWLEQDGGSRSLAWGQVGRVGVCAVPSFWAFKRNLRCSSIGDAHRWTRPAASWGPHTSLGSGWTWDEQTLEGTLITQRSWCQGGLAAHCVTAPSGRPQLNHPPGSPTISIPFWRQPSVLGLSQHLYFYCHLESQIAYEACGFENLRSKGSLCNMLIGQVFVVWKMRPWA